MCQLRRDSISQSCNLPNQNTIGKRFFLYVKSPCQPSLSLSHKFAKMPSAVQEKAEVLNDSVQTDDDIHELKKKLRAVKTMPWDLWEIDSSMKANSGSVGHSSLLSIQMVPKPFRQTSIICTIGPVSRDVETLKSVRVFEQ